MEFLETLLSSQEFTVIFRLFLALLMGAAIGTERSRKGSPAGLKTHALVCLGSALVMLTSEFALNRFQTGDITRMPAQVISGIGFLGAGTILVTPKNQIKGLTSAAGIWFSACVGLAIGIEFYSAALFAAFLEIFVIKALSKIRMKNVDKNIFEIYLEYDESFNLGQILKILRSMECEIITIDNNKFKAFEHHLEEFHYVILTLKFAKESQVDELLGILQESDGVIQASDI